MQGRAGQEGYRENPDEPIVCCMLYYIYICYICGPVGFIKVFLSSPTVILNDL